MEKRTSAFARIAAALALVGAVVLVIVVISGSLDGSGSSSKNGGGTHVAKKHVKPKTKAATYEVKTGDTLTAIAHKTGIPVATIRTLNPEIDPQILIAGETLKLR
jgi:LysM repeat protein